MFPNKRAHRKFSSWPDFTFIKKKKGRMDTHLLEIRSAAVHSCRIDLTTNMPVVNQEPMRRAFVSL